MQQAVRSSDALTSEALNSDALMWITDRPALTFVRGEGSWLVDDAGRRFLDFVQGWAVNTLGHAPSEVRKALREQSAQLINCSPAFHNARAIELARLLVGASVFDRVFLANTGAEANEGAVKLARKWGAKHRDGAYEVITFRNGFHGRTLAMMSASGKPHWDQLFEPKVPGFPKADLGDIAAVERLIGPKTVAVMVEPIQGESGVIPAGEEFLRQLRALTTKRGLLLIVDEVQTGVGRTGRLWGYEHAGIEPDIMTLAKGIGGGVPLAALLAREHCCVFEAGDQGGTFNGNPLMAAVGVAIMRRVIEPAFLAQVQARGEQLAVGLRSISSALGLGEVRGRGLLLALDLRRDCAARVVEAAREHQLLINAPRPATLRFMPALNVTTGEIQLCLERLERSIRAALA